MLEKHAFENEIEKNRIHEDSIIAIADSNGVIRYVNEAFQHSYGYSKTEAIGKTFAIIRNTKTPPSLHKNLWASLKHNGSWSGIIKNRTKTNDDFVVKTDISTFIYENKVYYLAESTNITLCINDIDKFYHNYTNKISDLHTRDVLIDIVKHRNEQFFQLAIFDINYFNSINDYFGFENGDLLIKKIAKIIVNHLDVTDYQLYHISVDEFALISLYNEKSERKNFKDLCKTIIDHIETISIRLLDDLEINVGISAGLSCGTDVWDVLKEANLALSYSKANNKHLVDFTRVEELNESLHKKMFWLKELNKAIADEKIEPYVQAISDNKTGEIIKYEALMRLVDSKNEIISPFHFLDIVKPTKMYEKISMMMIKKTLLAFSHYDIHFSINISWEDVKSIKTHEMIISILDKYEDLGPRMTVEIVESESINNFEVFTDFLFKLKAYGVKVALDDFGSGYSNFVYLDKINADYVKIDGSLIQEILTNKRIEQIVVSIVNLAKQFNIEIIAEFVSDEAIYNKVKELGIDYSQGYFIEKPVSINNIL